MDYTGKIAVVTGAGGVLCSVIAKKLAAQGAKVVLMGRTREKLEAVAEEIRKEGGLCLIKTCDVTKEEQVKKAADEIKEEWGLCDYLVNGAGGNNSKAVTTVNEFTPEELKEGEGVPQGFFNLDCEISMQVLEINTMGTVIPCRVFGRQMVEKGGGSIVNFASMNSYKPLTRNLAYAMGKAAIVNFTEWLANYLAPAGIRVNGVAPGFFINNRSRKIMYTPEGDLTQRGLNVMAHTPMKRFGEAAELWGCIDWLLDDEKAGFVTGVTIPVDGGFIAHPGI